MSDFFEQDYEIPNTSNYMKWEEGANTFRILGSFKDGTAIMGTEYWKTKADGKRGPIRLRMGLPVAVGELEINPLTGEMDFPKHFWALPVWNYTAKKVQILEITQKSIQQAIKNLADNVKWGDPTTYDIVCTQIKEGKKTSYTVTPDPKEALAKDIQEIVKQTTVNIKALFDDEDPFGSSGKVEEEEISEQNLELISETLNK